MTERKVIAMTHCASQGECVVCDDGAVFYSFPNGDKPRAWIEGTAVPGTPREEGQKADPPQDYRPPTER